MSSELPKPTKPTPTVSTFEAIRRCRLLLEDNNTPTNTMHFTLAEFYTEAIERLIKIAVRKRTTKKEKNT
ncbi:MAG: hypothetical protein ACRD50_10180 [Candidatus Acidiferrales bacterium]